MCEFTVQNETAKQIKLIRKYLKLKIMEDNVSFRNHTQERNHVYDLMKRTVSHGESHSALMIGPRGSGKTTLLNSVLHQLDKEVDLENDAIVVKLNGLIHSDEKIALKSITAQMQLENAVGDRVFGTFAENLAFLLSCLQSGADRRCKSMLFVLEQMDMFCKTGRTQTLLYNLFDITHSGNSPMCVLGVTNRLDVMELLEKRVKSRFSHRHILIFPTAENQLPTEYYKKEEEERVNRITCGSLMMHRRRLRDANNPLELSEERFITLFRVSKEIALALIQAIEADVRRSRAHGLPVHVIVMVDLLSMPVKKVVKRRRRSASISTDQKQIDTDYTIPDKILYKCRVDPSEFDSLAPTFVQDWNSHVGALAEDDKVCNAIEKFCYYTVNEQSFRNILVVSKLRITAPFIDSTELSLAIDKTVAPEHTVKLLHSLSILELSLVVAMKHGMDIFDQQPMNFEMVLHRYTKFSNTNSSTQTVPRPVILKAFEHLQALEIIMPVKNTDSIYNAAETTASRVQKEYKLYTLAVPVDDITEAVKTFKALPTEISHWYNNSVV